MGDTATLAVPTATDTPHTDTATITASAALMPSPDMDTVAPTTAADTATVTDTVTVAATTATASKVRAQTTPPLYANATHLYRLTQGTTIGCASFMPTQ